MRMSGHCWRKVSETRNFSIDGIPWPMMPIETDVFTNGDYLAQMASEGSGVSRSFPNGLPRGHHGFVRADVKYFRHIVRAIVRFQYQNL